MPLATCLVPNWTSFWAVALMAGECENEGEKKRDSLLAWFTTNGVNERQNQESPGALRRSSSFVCMKSWQTPQT
jgi:hypothetical protein